VVLGTRFETLVEVVIIPERSSTNVPVKPAFVETCTLYVEALAAADQDRVVGTNTPVAPLAGEVSTGTSGTGGGGVAVVKLQTAEGALLPLVLIALTRQ
jgi:hypothetical protein